MRNERKSTQRRVEIMKVVSDNNDQDPKTIQDEDFLGSAK